MDISTFLTQIATGLASFFPALAGALANGFVALFFTTGTNDAVTGLNPLGIISISFFSVGLAQKFLPGVLSWLKARWRSARARRARRAR